MKTPSQSYGVSLGLHSVTCHLTQVNTPRLNYSQRPVLDLPTPEGWKAELTYVTGYIEMVYPHTDGHTMIQVLTR